MGPRLILQPACWISLPGCLRGPSMNLQTRYIFPCIPYTAHPQSPLCEWIATPSTQTSEPKSWILASTHYSPNLVLSLKWVSNPSPTSYLDCLRSMKVFPCTSRGRSSQQQWLRDHGWFCLLHLLLNYKCPSSGLNSKTKSTKPALIGLKILTLCPGEPCFSQLGLLNWSWPEIPTPPTYSAPDSSGTCLPLTPLPHPLPAHSEMLCRASALWTLSLG